MNTVTVYDFMKWRRAFVVLSVLLVLASIASLAVRQVQFGLDFTGGTELRLYFAEPVDPAAVRGVLADAGLGGVVKRYGSERDILVQLPAAVDEAEVSGLMNALAGQGHTAQINSMDMVGPQVGADLRDQGGLALLAALGMILVYIAFRFQAKFALAAVLALAHDVIITLGIYSLVGWDFDLTVLAALLALIGYSLNDTIVVFDRIRENLRKLRKETPLEVINISLSQVLSRTIATSLTTMLVLGAMFFVGGAGVHEFARTLLIGLVVGTYSSIFVAASLLLVLNASSADLVRPEQNRKELEDGVV